MNENSVVLKLIIDEPLWLSSKQDSDILLIDIIHPELIRIKESHQMIHKGITQRKEIPP